MATAEQGVEKRLPLSTEYLTPEIAQFIADLADVFRPQHTDAGLVIYVPEQIPDGTPDDLAVLLETAASLGCWWIDFDHAVPPYDDLETPDYTLAAAA